MAFEAEAVAVDDTATLVYTFTAENQSISVQNYPGSDPVELGGAGLEFGDGPLLSAGDSMPISGFVNESVYAICDTSGTADVRVLKQGV